jgi:hypothetical protein
MEFLDGKMPRGAAHSAYTGGRRPWDQIVEERERRDDFCIDDIDNGLLLLIEFPHPALVSLTKVMRNS